MNRRTEGEIKAYVDGYTKCYNDFTEYLKGRKSVADAARKMDMLLTAVKAVLEQEVENE
jgi:acylphosphatase